jgi:hypothetical protein
MRWIIVTCDATRHIVPAQQWLFKKYAPGVELVYIDVEKDDINTWGHNVLRKLPDDRLVVFGLDDYLPIDHLDIEALEVACKIALFTEVERFELGWGAVHGFNQGKHLRDAFRGHPFLWYPRDAVYSVSCQFSVWKMSALTYILYRCTTPWNFEKKHTALAACFEKPVFRWIEESALSSRHPGKINVLGLRPADLEELIGLGLINRSRIQYGMPKGPVPPFDPKALGPKYKPFYE